MVSLHTYEVEPKFAQLLMAVLITAVTRSLAKYVEEESLVATANIEGVDTDFCRGRRACKRRNSSSRFNRIFLKSFCKQEIREE